MLSALFHLLPLITFTVLLLTHIFLYLVHFFVAPLALWKFNDESLSYIHKINYSEDEIELVQLDILLIHT